MRNKKIAFCMLLILGSLIFISFASAYTYSSYSSNYNNVMGIISSSGGQSLQLDESTCVQGNDFVIQISPLSCEPSVVTSDLLEEENVNVYCKMVGYQMNPLIDVSQIDAISFSKEYPREVLGIGYMPAQSALGYTKDNLDGSLLLNNLGYVVITLRKQPNESALTNCEDSIGGDICYIKGNLTATLRYDIRNSFGVGNAMFYLPEISDEEWERDYLRYSFWDGRGYLRVDSISEDGATLSIYSDNTVATSILSGERTYKLARYNSNIRLGVGQTSNKIYLPGLSPCLGSLELELVDIENPDTVAQLRVNEEYIEVKESESFLDNKCTLKKMTRDGVKQVVKISCSEDGGTKTHTFTISPKISLKIGDAEPKSYELGQLLYISPDRRGVYLGYIGTYNNIVTEDFSDIYVYLVALDKQDDKLTDSDLNSISTFANLVSSKSSKDTFSGKVTSFMKDYFVKAPLSIGSKIISGTERQLLDSSPGSESVDFLNNRVSLVGFSSAENEADLSTSEESYAKYYQNAMNDFDKDVNTYPTERESETETQTFGERALREEIELAEYANQKRTMFELCRKFAQDYPKSLESLSQCINVLKTANFGITTEDITINNVVRRIYFDGISEPSLNEYSATLIVQGDGGTETYILRKNIAIQLKQLKKTEEINPEYVTLKDLDVDKATITLNLGGCPTNSGSKIQTMSESMPFTKNSPQTYCGYTFTVTDITLNKVAKVKIITNTDLARSNSTFSFKIGVEKRAIQLSPEKAQEKIRRLNNTIETIDKINKYLDGIVKTMRAACVVTEGWLTIKNALANKDGKSAARQEIMTSTGGWNDKCNDMIKRGLPGSDGKRYKSLNDCFLDNSDAIESDVNVLASANNARNAILNEVKQNTGITDINDQKLISAYSEKVSEKLDDLIKSGALSGKITDSELEKIKEALSSERVVEKGAYNIDNLNDIETYTLFLLSKSDSGQIDNMAIDKLKSAISEVNVNSENVIKQIALESETGMKDNCMYKSLKGQKYETVLVRDPEFFKDTPYTKSKGFIQETPISDLDYAWSVTDPDTKIEYLVIYSATKGVIQTYRIIEQNLPIIPVSALKIYRNEKGVNEFNPFHLEFKIAATSDTENEYLKSYGSNEPLVYYFDTPYQKLPAVIPLDLEKGWYVGVEDPSTSYDKSGKIERFWICNVGGDKIESFLVSNPRFGGDDCSLVDLTKTRTIGDAAYAKYIDKARSEIQSLTTQYRPGITQVSVSNLVVNKNHPSKIVKVGRPVSQTSSSGECTDIWSVEDCTKLFNVCDPVVCPSSRCNLGGNYDVKDVAGSGIIGSVALCLPNFKLTGGDVYIPVCLSGINAGLEGLNSVLKANSDCLQRYLDSGETVGICDEMNSVYLCELFWKEAVPIIKYFSKGLIDKIDAQKGGGGGEYRNFAAALKNAQTSIDYFKQYYDANSYRGTGKSSTEELSSTICGSFASLVVGNVGSFIDNLISSDSPYQFIGKFEETQITTATNPPTSKYKVWYHIYAGTQVSVYYSVYLRGTGSSYYQDNSNSRMVASGYIERGKYADESIDFTANSGYSKLCINVNGHEECGFKEVSTSFAVNYMSDLYLKDQASNTNVTTQNECTSGTASIYSIIDLNVASIIDNLANPELYTQGIIRTCASQNPGAGVNEKKWKDVGYCGDKKVRCWIDMESVEDAIKTLNLEDSTKESIEASQKFLNSNYMTEEQFEGNKSIIESAGPVERIAIINDILNGEKVFYNYQKAYLYLWRGKAYAELVRSSYGLFKIKESTEVQSDAERQQRINKFFEGYTSPIFEFQDSRIAENVLYRYFDSEWHWMMRSSINSYSCLTQTTPTSGTYPTMNFNTEEISCWADPDATQDGLGKSPNLEGRTFTASLQGKSYMEGLKALVDHTISYRAIGGTVKGDLYTYNTKYTIMSHEPVFTVKTSDESYYKYVPATGWYWSLDEKNWVSVSTKSINGQSPSSDVITYLTALDNELSIYEGAAILFEENPITMMDVFDRGGTTGVECYGPQWKCIGTDYYECYDSEWVFKRIDYEKCKGTGTTTTTTQEIFLVKKSFLDINKYDQYYKYDSGWQWTVDTTPSEIDWTPVTKTTVEDGLFKGYTSSNKNLKIMELLRGRNYYEGREILKDNGATMEDGSTIPLIITTGETSSGTITSSDQIFLVEKKFLEFGAYDQYFNYNQGWRWTVDTTPSEIDWTPVTKTTVEDGLFKGYAPPTRILNIMETLKIKGFLQGREILKDNGATMEDGSEIYLSPGCAPESNTVFCKRFYKECGSVTGKDNCNIPRTVSCGTCIKGQTCYDGKCWTSGTATCTDTCSSLGYECGTQTICEKSVNCGTCSTGTCNSVGKCVTSGTIPEVDLSDFSSAEQKVITNADTCTDCGGALIDFNRCDKLECDAIAKKLGRECTYVYTSRKCEEKITCTPETDNTFCKRLGKNCGSFTGTDNCGKTRTISSCGTCTSPEICNTATGQCVTGGTGTTNTCPAGTTYLGKQDGYEDGVLTKVDICNVKEIKVNVEIAEGILRLVNDAKSERNINFSKNVIGFRTLEEQIEEYEANCNDEKYTSCNFTITTFPSPQDSIIDYYNLCHIGNNIKATCSPSTASPGYSNHQMGLAIDFQCWIGGVRYTPFKDTICYSWLVENSNRYGLKPYYIANEEFWHWSVDGH